MKNRAGAATTQSGKPRQGRNRRRDDRDDSRDSGPLEPVSAACHEERVKGGPSLWTCVSGGNHQVPAFGCTCSVMQGISGLTVPVRIAGRRLTGALGAAIADNARYSDRGQGRLHIWQKARGSSPERPSLVGVWSFRGGPSFNLWPFRLGQRTSQCANRLRQRFPMPHRRAARAPRNGRRALPSLLPAVDLVSQPTVEDPLRITHSHAMSDSSEHGGIKAKDQTKGGPYARLNPSLLLPPSPSRSTSRRTDTAR